MHCEQGCEGFAEPRPYSPKELFIRISPCNVPQWPPVTCQPIRMRADDIPEDWKRGEETHIFLFACPMSCVMLV